MSTAKEKALAAKDGGPLYVPQGVVAVGEDDNGAYLGEPVSYAGEGWKKVWGFFDGVRGVTDRVEGITGDLAGTVNTVTETKRNIWDLKSDKEAFEQSQQLERVKVMRGDNVKLYAVAGAAAVALILLTVRG